MGLVIRSPEELYASGDRKEVSDYRYQLIFMSQNPEIEELSDEEVAQAQAAIKTLGDWLTAFDGPDPVLPVKPNLPGHT